MFRSEAVSEHWYGSHGGEKTPIRIGRVANCPCTITANGVNTKGFQLTAPGLSGVAFMQHSENTFNKPPHINKQGKKHRERRNHDFFRFKTFIPSTPSNNY